MSWAGPRPVLVFDPLTWDGVYEWRPTPPLPSRPARTWRHRCPDGTEVEVSGRYLTVTGVTLYTWRVPGRRAEFSSTVGEPVEPDFTAVDAAHPAAGRKAS